MILHILSIIFNSFLTTLFLMPISTLDAYFVATFSKHKVYITIPIMVIADIFTAIVAYKLSYWLIPKVVKKDKNKQKLFNIGEKMDKWGWWLVIIAAATPFPYTLTIYACGSVKWGNNLRIGSAIGIGKSVRYTVIAIAIYYGYKLI